MEPSPPLAELIGMLRDGCSSVEEEGKILEQLLKLSHKSANAAAMVANGLLAPLVALLQRGPQQNRAASAAILMNVSTNSERQAKIIQAGALVALVGLLWAGNDAARAYAAGALMNLATSVDAQLMMVERGAVEALVDMLSKRSVLGRMNAAGALRNIAASNRKNKEVIVWNGALEPLVNVLRSSNYLARSNAVRERGPRVVGSMCTADAVARGTARGLAPGPGFGLTVSAAAHARTTLRRRVLCVGAVRPSVPPSPALRQRRGCPASVTLFWLSQVGALTNLAFTSMLQSRIVRSARRINPRHGAVLQPLRSPPHQLRACAPQPVGRPTGRRMRCPRFGHGALRVQHRRRRAAAVHASRRAQGRRPAR